MPYIDKPIDQNQVMITTFDELIAPDSTSFPPNVVADKSYYRDEDYIACLENGIIPNVMPDDGKDTYALEVEN